jgi:hypothetical protein
MEGGKSWQVSREFLMEFLKGREKRGRKPLRPGTDG